MATTYVYQMATKYIKFLQNISNGNKIYQIAVKRPKGQKIDQHLPLQDPSKFTQIGTSGGKYTIWQPW
jgi:hypothetical protein